MRCKARKCSEINQPGEPGGLRWDSAHVAAHVKICCINFGENQPKTRWEPCGNPVCCGWDLVFDVAHVKLCLCSNFGGIWPLTGGNPEDRVRDPAYVVAHVKLYMCTSFGGIWPLNQWKPGGTRRTGSKPGLCCAHCQTAFVYQIWCQSARRFSHYPR